MPIKMPSWTRGEQNVRVFGISGGTALFRPPHSTKKLAAGANTKSLSRTSEFEARYLADCCCNYYRWRLEQEEAVVFFNSRRILKRRTGGSLLLLDVAALHCVHSFLQGREIFWQPVCIIRRDRGSIYHKFLSAKFRG